MDMNRKKISNSTQKFRCECRPGPVEVKKHFNPSTGPVKLDYNLPEINWFYNPELNLLFHQFGHKIGQNGTEKTAAGGTDTPRGRSNAQWTRKSSLQMTQPSSSTIKSSENAGKRRGGRNKSAPPCGVGKFESKGGGASKRALSAPGDKKVPQNSPKTSPVMNARSKMKSPPARKGPPDKGQPSQHLQNVKKEIVVSKPSGAVWHKPTKGTNFVPTVTTTPKARFRSSEKEATLAKLQEEIKHLKANNLKTFEEHIKDLKREISDFRKSDVAKKCNVECTSKPSTAVGSRERKDKEWERVCEERCCSSKKEFGRKGGSPATPRRARSPGFKNVDMRYALQHPTNQLENLFIAENCCVFESDSQEETVLLNKIHEANELIEKVKDTLNVIKSKEYKKATKEIQNNHPNSPNFQQSQKLHQNFCHAPCSPPTHHRFQQQQQKTQKQECARPCTPRKCKRDSGTDAPVGLAQQQQQQQPIGNANDMPLPCPTDMKEQCPSDMGQPCSGEDSATRPKTRRPFTTADTSSTCEKSCTEELPDYSYIDKFLNAPGEFIEEDTSSTERLKQKLRTISEKSESEISKTTVENIESEVASDQKVDIVIESVRSSKEDSQLESVAEKTEKTEKTIQTCIDCADKAIGSDEESENVIVDSITEIRYLVERLLESVTELQGLDPATEQSVFDKISQMVHKTDKERKSNKLKFVESVVKDIVKDIVKYEVQEDRGGRARCSSCSSYATDVKDSIAGTSVTFIPCTDSAIEKAVREMKSSSANTDQYMVCACRSLSITNFPPNTICCRSMKSMENNNNQLSKVVDEDPEVKDDNKGNEIEDTSKPNSAQNESEETSKPTLDQESSNVFEYSSSATNKDPENSETLEDLEEKTHLEIDSKQIFEDAPNVHKKMHIHAEIKIGDARIISSDEKKFENALTNFNPSRASSLNTKKISNLSIQKLPCINIHHPLQVRRVINLFINESGRSMNSVPDGENVVYVEVETKAQHKATKFMTNFSSKAPKSIPSGKNSSRYSDRNSSTNGRKSGVSTTTIDSAGDSKKEELESVTTNLSQATVSRLDQSKSTEDLHSSPTDVDEGKAENALDIASDNYSMTYDSSPSPSSISHRTKSSKKPSTKSGSRKSTSRRSVKQKSTTSSFDMSSKSSNQISTCSFPPLKKYQLVEYGFLKHQETQFSEGRRSLLPSNRSSIVQRSEHSYNAINEIAYKGDVLDQIAIGSESFTNESASRTSSNYLSRTTIVKSKRTVGGETGLSQCSAGDFPQSDSKDCSRTTTAVLKDNMQQGDVSDMETIMGNKGNAISSSSMTNDYSYLQENKSHPFNLDFKNGVKPESDQQVVKRETVTFDSKVEVRGDTCKAKSESNSSRKSKGREWYCSPFVNKYIKLSSTDKNLSNKKGKKRDKKKGPGSVQTESVSCSEGEICKCDVSLGEVHDCNNSIMSVKNRLFPQSLGILKSNLKVEKHRTYFNNWVTYYINEGSRTFDPTTTASSSTDFKI